MENEAKGSRLLQNRRGVLSAGPRADRQQRQLRHADGSGRPRWRGPLHQLHHALHRAGDRRRGHQPAGAAGLSAGKLTDTRETELLILIRSEKIKVDTSRKNVFFQKENKSPLLENATFLDDHEKSSISRLI